MKSSTSHALRVSTEADRLVKIVRQTPTLRVMKAPVIHVRPARTPTRVRRDRRPIVRHRPAVRVKFTMLPAAPVNPSARVIRSGTARVAKSTTVVWVTKPGTVRLA